MARSNSELQVITYAKKLSSYVMTITQKSSNNTAGNLADHLAL